MRSTFVPRLVRFCAAAALLALAMAVADRHHWLSVAADTPFPGFAGGNLVVSRSVYPDAGSAPVIVPNVTILPGTANATAFTAVAPATTASGPCFRRPA